MKYTLLSLVTLLCSSVMLRAQAPISGCDGVRYTQKVFTESTVDIVPYGSNVGSAGGNPVTMYMDVYEPKGDTAAFRPAIVVAHGGTFIFGEKNDMAAYCQELASRGYVAVTIQYRLWPVFQLGVPDSTKILRQAIMAMGDMKCAIRYLREDAATVNKYRIHPDWIFAGGYSAGAVAALSVAQLDTTDQIPAFIKAAIDGQGGIDGSTGTATNKTYSSSVKAVLSLSGGMYSPEWLDTGDVPFHSIHGTADATVFYTSGLAAGLVTLHGSGNLHDKATAIGLPNTLKTVPGGGHTDIYSSPVYAQAVLDYFNTATIQLHNMFCTPLDTDTPNALEAAWSLAPNPTTDQVRITLPNATQPANVSVYNAFGKLLLTTLVSDGGTLSLGHLATGLYFVQVSGEREVLKVVKD